MRRERQILQRLREPRCDFRATEKRALRAERVVRKRKISDGAVNKNERESASRAVRVVWRRKISNDDDGIDGRGDDCGDDNDDGVCDSGLQSTLAPIFFLCCK